MHTQYNTVQACFVLETFYHEILPMRALSRPARSAWLIPTKRISRTDWFLQKGMADDIYIYISTPFVVLVSRFLGFSVPDQQYFYFCVLSASRHTLQHYKYSWAMELPSWQQMTVLCVFFLLLKPWALMTEQHVFLCRLESVDMLTTQTGPTTFGSFGFLFPATRCKFMETVTGR